MSKLSVGFNQDSSLITVGSTRGFSVYRCNPFKKCFQAADGSIKFVEMLFSTSLVALVGSGKQAAFSPRRIRLYSTKTRQFICELDFATTVLNVKMNNKRLVAVLETKIHIFDLETLNILHTLRTPSNPRGVIALSSNVNNGFMALPGHDSKGEILIYDVINCQVRSSNNACNNPIQNLSMNAEGTMLAAASTQVLYCQRIWWWWFSVMMAVYMVPHVSCAAAVYYPDHGHP
uniref:Autophagy-related protein 18 n=1 Tax=Lotharella globosa TaxID=91324 RepID=A0A7S3YVB8_9EUKA|mmetsp:Transcript_20219/g.39002  ORF Transcript_20219/g.39002 Transcript_20219/m.39002 type:complete len:232 (+) Transcript_20219:74-769(+)